MTGSEWDRAPWSEPFVDIEGDLKPKPRFLTRMKMLWDAECLYIGAEMEEPDVWATLTEHDSVIFQDNDFEIFLDPDGDHHRYLELELNALNTLWDLRLVKPYRAGGPAENEWEAVGIRTAVSIDGTLNDPSDRDRGWSCTFAIPWAALASNAGVACPPAEGDTWRINFSRVEWDVTAEGDRYVKVPDRPEHNWVWSPQGVIDMHRPEMWGYLQFASADAPLETLRRDPDWSVRKALDVVFDRQLEYRSKHGVWAETFADLPEGVRLRRTEAGWVAEATGPSGRRYRKTEDSRITVIDAPTAG